MKTPEEIAREAAEGAVEVVETAMGWHAIYTVPLRDPDGVNARVARCEGHLYDVILAAVERALRDVPVPGGLGEARLADIAEKNELDAFWISDDARRVIRQLLAHADHLTRCLHDCGQDGSAAQWAAGYEAGRRAGFREGAQAQQARDVEVASSVAAIHPDVRGSVIVQAVSDAPLAEPEDKR